MDRRGQWPVSFSSSTDTKGSFCLSVSCVPRILFMSIPRLESNSGDACITLFSLPDGWNLSPSQYYISIPTFIFILESCLVSWWEGESQLIETWYFWKWERGGCSYLDCFLEAARLIFFLKTVQVQAELVFFKNMLTSLLRNIKKLFQRRKVLFPSRSPRNHSTSAFIAPGKKVVHNAVLETCLK